jgi:NACalpha-BTF3-like transcription factor
VFSSLSTRVRILTNQKKTMNDMIATTEDDIAMMMAMGMATKVDEAYWALEECGGDVDRAIALLTARSDRQ